MLDLDRQMLTGKLNGELRGNLGERCSGQGHLTLNTARIYNIPVSQMRIPIAATLFPSRQELLVRSDRISARVARGQVDARAEVSLGTPHRP